MYALTEQSPRRNAWLGPPVGGGWCASVPDRQVHYNFMERPQSRCLCGPGGHSASIVVMSVSISQLTRRLVPVDGMRFIHAPVQCPRRHGGSRTASQIHTHTQHRPQSPISGVEA